VTRLALGAVTATAGPAIASLTGDHFPARERGRVYAYILGGGIAGEAAGYIGGGSVTSGISWRAAFIVLALPASSWHARFGGRSRAAARRAEQARAGGDRPPVAIARAPLGGRPARRSRRCAGGQRACAGGGQAARRPSRSQARAGRGSATHGASASSPPAGTTRPGSEPGADHRSCCGQGPQRARGRSRHRVMIRAGARTTAPRPAQRW
jgi:Major Facilitator Superfamily